MDCNKRITGETEKQRITKTLVRATANNAPRCGLVCLLAAMNNKCFADEGL